MNTLGDVIRVLRLSRHWTQEEMAFRLDISLAAYSKIERNITDINLSRLKQIAEVLELKLSELISISEDTEGIFPFI